MANSQLPLFFPLFFPPLSPLSRKSGQDTRNSRVEELLLPTFLSPLSSRIFFAFLPFSASQRRRKKEGGGRGRKEEGSSSRVGSSLSGEGLYLEPGNLQVFFSH